MRPKATKWLIIVLKSLYPVFGKHPEFGEFTLVACFLIVIRNFFFVSHTYHFNTCGVTAGIVSLLRDSMYVSSSLNQARMKLPCFYPQFNITVEISSMGLVSFYRSYSFATIA